MNNSDVHRCSVALFRSGWLQEQCEKAGVTTHVIPHRGIADISWIRRIASLIRRDRVSIVHAHEFDAIVHGTMAAYWARIPIVATIHGKNYYWEKARRRFAYRLVSRYAKMVAVSKDLQKFVVDRVGIAGHRIRVIYNGVSDLPPGNEGAINNLRLELDLPVNVQIVGVIGSLYPVKGHRFLIDAIPAIVKAHANTRFLFIGRGELEATLKEQAKSLGIEGHVRFLGLRNDVPQLLSLIDMLVVPSLSEGLSMSILEAMMAGKPVIATSVGGNPELVVQGDTGLLVPSRDSISLAREINSLLADPTTSRKMGRNGHDIVSRYFTHRNMVQSYRNLYEEVLK